MATDDIKNDSIDAVSDIMSVEDIFGSEVSEDLTEQDIFVGDDEFLQMLNDSFRPAPVVSSKSRLTEVPHSPLPETHRPFFTLQRVLATCIVTIAAMLGYSFMKSSGITLSNPFTNHPTPSPQGQTAEQPTVTSQNPTETSPMSTPEKPLMGQFTFSQTQPLSLKLAQDFYTNAEYNKAYAAYKQLLNNLPTLDSQGVIRDFLELRMALCVSKASISMSPDQARDAIDKAGIGFNSLAQSRSIVVRALSDYELGLILVNKRQYLKAMSHLYRAISSIDAAGLETDISSVIKRNCHFMAARCLTSEVLALSDADKDLPAKLWCKMDLADPFENVDETQLRHILSKGNDKFRAAIFGPKVATIEGATELFSGVCDGASIEELTARFAANANINIKWALDRSAQTQITESTFRQRPVILFLSSATPRQFMSIAAGSVGLLAVFDNNDMGKTVTICNPDDYSSLSEHLSLIYEQAISSWQQFMMMFPNDGSFDSVHLAMGILNANNGRINRAIAEYKLVANRYSRSSLAPFALLYSSKLKTSIKDYNGARDDLRKLVEMYPDSEFADVACLNLAQAARKAGYYDEAVRLFEKVFKLGLSSKFQIAAAFGAGNCYFEKKDYQKAEKWLSEYINLNSDRDDRNLYLANIKLGKTNLELSRPEQACIAFENALTGTLDQEQYIETVGDLVETYIAREMFLEALNVLENVNYSQFSPAESVDMLLVRTRLLRSMQLYEKAARLLDEKINYISDSQLKVKVSFELAKCDIAKGDLDSARERLAGILTVAQAGQLANEAALDLARVCLRLNKEARVVSICTELLQWQPDQKIKAGALELLATANSRMHNSDGAALALLGHWNKDTHSNRND